MEPIVQEMRDSAFKLERTADSYIQTKKGLADFRTRDISATADGKRLSFVKTRIQHSIYIASLGRGGKPIVGKAVRLTTDTWARTVDGWSTDSNAVYLSSDRVEGSGYIAKTFTSRFLNS